MTSQKKKRNQHWVPQFYLNGFVDPTAPTPEPYVWVADLHLGTIRNKAPKHLACLPHAYEVEELEAQGQSLEDIFMKVESAAATGVCRLAMSSPISLSLQERLHLSVFIALQLARTPRFWFTAATALYERAISRVGRLLTDDEYLESIRRRCGREDGIDRQALGTAIRRIVLAPTRAGVAGVSLATGLGLAEVFWNMRWSRLVTEDGEFCTTDNPVTLLTPDAQPREVGHPQLLVGFPISPRVLLVLDNRTEDVRDDLLSNADVEQIVRGILPTADRFVFCASRERAEWALGEVRQGQREPSNKP